MNNKVIKIYSSYAITLVVAVSVFFYLNIQKSSADTITSCPVGLYFYGGRCWTQTEWYADGGCGGAGGGSDCCE